MKEAEKGLNNCLCHSMRGVWVHIQNNVKKAKPFHARKVNIGRKQEGVEVALAQRD
jgi:hypothetical protein